MSKVLIVYYTLSLSSQISHTKFYWNGNWDSSHWPEALKRTMPECPLLSQVPSCSVTLPTLQSCPEAIAPWGKICFLFLSFPPIIFFWQGLTVSITLELVINNNRILGSTCLPTSECWDDRCMPPHPVYEVLGMAGKAFAQASTHWLSSVLSPVSSYPPI